MSIAFARYDIDEAGEERAVESYCLKLSRRERRDIKRRGGMKALIRRLMERGDLREYGCDCSHCANDWDCCGRFILMSNRYREAGRRHIRIEQHLARNI